MITGKIGKQALRRHSGIRGNPEWEMGALQIDHLSSSAPIKHGEPGGGGSWVRNRHGKALHTHRHWLKVVLPYWIQREKAFRNGIPRDVVLPCERKTNQRGGDIADFRPRAPGI
ncbi:MAG: hypothetical protein IPH16_05455 [Haliscomenobacter sp.]|nr:hypothetical protein [Haliscomenobacter sp.]